MKNAIVCGAGGFIGGHMVKRLKQEGYYVVGYDRKHPEFEPSKADEFRLWDLCNPLMFGNDVDELYQLAADMGGADYIFSGTNDADIMRNSALINLNVLEACRRAKVGKVFFSSSACIYPDYVQVNPDHCELHEEMAYPARPDSEYGFEKLFAERLYSAYARNHNLSVRVGRLHNIFGSFCTYMGGREKAPAAICRKVALAPRSGGSIDIYGTGEQTRSFLHVSECVEGIRRLMNSDFAGPVNIGSSEMISINGLVSMVCDIAGKDLAINHIPGPLGVHARSSNNDLIREKLGWAPSAPLRAGMTDLYRWIESEVMRNSTVARSDRGSPHTKKPLSADLPGGA
jgi:GDP-D-mannose 3',5'-epimerase